MGITKNSLNIKHSRIARSPHPRSLRYYLSHPRSRHSKTIGRLATIAYFQVKEFLNKEIELPHPIDFRESLSKIIPKASYADAIDSSVTSEGLLNGSDNLEAGPMVLVEQPQKHPDHKELKNIAQRSNEMLATATTVFPITLFPDTIDLDRTKITITKRNFFFSNQTISIRIEDVLNVASSVGPFLGSVTIASRILSSEDHFTINHFWRRDAIHLKHMIQGYVIALHNKIDVAHLDKEELISTLSELGHDSNA